MLAYTYDPDLHDPTGWLMSEKLDGVRCYWNGKNMYTRNGNKIYAP
jgi:DNA ligase-1